MKALNKQALLRAAVKIGVEKWTHDGNGEVITEEYMADGQALVDHICNCEVVGTSSLRAEFIAVANPAAILVLLHELEAAEKRIAELEARTITLPQRLQPGADGYDDWYVHSANDGEYLKVDDVIAAIRAAGIGVKGE